MEPGRTIKGYISARKYVEKDVVSVLLGVCAAGAPVAAAVPQEVRDEVDR